MSGRKQHYLPQFLQRPFAHRKNKGTFYVHVHEKSSSYSPSTAGIGAKRDFYSIPDDSRADDNITSTESVLGQTINQIILTGLLPSNAEVARLFSSLSVRTLKMRNALSEMAPNLITSIRNMAREKDFLMGVMKEQINDKHWLERSMNKELRNTGINDRNKRALIKHQFRLKAKRDFEHNKSKLLAEFEVVADKELSRLWYEAADIADKAFVEAFTNSDGMAKRDKSFSRFDYELIKNDSNSFLLGDCAVTALDTNRIPRLAMADVDKEVRLCDIFLPISPNLTIHGSRDGNASQHPPNVINELSVKLSNQFFISYHQTTPEMERLKPIIGSAIAPLVGLDELNAITLDSI